MYRPPSDPRRYRADTESTPSGILVSYLMVATVFLLLWAVHNPVTAVVASVAGVGLFIGSRGALRVAHCVATCGGYVFDIGGGIHVCITGPANDVSC